MADKTVLTDIESKIGSFLKDLEGKSEAELKGLYDKAIILESDLKRELTVLRQRAANLASTASTEVEQEVIKVKSDLENALAWLKAIEKKLFGVVKDYSTGQKFGDNR